jgi:hypothetical protein
MFSMTCSTGPSAVSGHPHSQIRSIRGLEGSRGGRAHIVAPPDGRVVATAHPPAIARSRAVGRLASHSPEVADALLDGFSPGRVPVLGFANPPGAFLQANRGRIVVLRLHVFCDLVGEMGVIVRVHLQKLLANLLHGAVEYNLGTVAESLHLPSNLDNAISGDG